GHPPRTLGAHPITPVKKLPPPSPSPAEDKALCQDSTGHVGAEKGQRTVAYAEKGAAVRIDEQETPRAGAKVQVAGKRVVNLKHASASHVDEVAVSTQLLPATSHSVADVFKIGAPEAPPHGAGLEGSAKGAFPSSESEQTTGSVPAGETSKGAAGDGNKADTVPESKKENESAQASPQAASDEEVAT
ncbi:hypothetical protein KFL_016270020, partial [Klebsormidium nitens]